VTTPEKLVVRLEQEREILLQTYPNALVKIDGLVVILADHTLGAGWSHQSTDVLFAIPANYPAGQPDNICARQDLTLLDGTSPANNQGIQVHDGRPWLQFSFHLEPGDWRPRAEPPAGSTLVDYLTGALTRFDEAS
jgi:hypothetical protein